ncbi:ECF transporter S component [Thermosphaera chiliense]|uniref:ECF transporter S component n=1 Tax=Thermosphaera chiliense TaxID=3402707 RepID=A0A7M1UPX3_9CREN|nr:ECF transporter S component [Thermosphaera aggregans]QOR94146.1 ECF transporter S component [Thermosphaera aggregans]
MSAKALGTRRIINIVVFTVLVYSATVVLQIYQPVTGGYFNLGESMIYLAALLTEPIVAAFAGGVGAALADISTGYGLFAPGTLVIKFIEGYVAGYLVKRFGKVYKAYYSMLAGGSLTVGLLLFGIFFYSGEVYVGPGEWAGITLEAPILNIPVWAWILIAFVIGGLATYGLSKNIVNFSETIALLIGGVLMVTGYFLYEYFVSNPLTGRPPVNAVFEIPVNVGQALVGIAVSIPVASWLRKAGFFEKE